METIQLSGQTLFQLGPLPVTNTLLMSWIVIALLGIVSYLGTKSIKIVPSGLQNILEMGVEGVYSMVSDLAHNRTRIIFPFVMTFFLFILFGNFLGLLPGFGTIGVHKIINGQDSLIPLFRSVNADLNTTLALALISAVATHVLAIKYLGIKDYLKRWVSLNPIFMFVGILEIISEFTKVISLSFRLFGNVFAGEILLSTISSFFAFVAPLPFYFLEIVVALVQAAVFMMLTLVFMVLLTEKHEA